MTNTDELKRLSKEARLGDLEIVSAGTFSRLVRVYSRKAGVYLTDVIDRDNAALIVAAVNALPELLAEVKRLEEALEKIADPATYSHSLPSCCQHTFDDTCELFSDIARAALNQEPGHD